MLMHILVFILFCKELLYLLAEKVVFELNNFMY